MSLYARINLPFLISMNPLDKLTEYLEGNVFVKGLLPHGSKFIDQGRAHELLSFIRKNLNRMSFEDIGVHSGKAEEYVFGKKKN